MLAKSDGTRSSRVRVYNEPISDSSSSFPDAPVPTGQIALPRSRWNLSFLDDELEFKFRQWFDANFRSTLVTPRITATMGTTLAVLAIIIFSSLLFSLQRLESPEGMLPTPVVLAGLLVFSSYCFGASFFQAQSSVWAKIAGLVFPATVIMTGVVIYHATSLSREVLQAEAHASEDMTSTSVDKLVLDIAAFLSLSIGGHAIQILCLRTLESEYTTLRLSMSIFLCSALGFSTTLEAYDLASTLPHLVIIFLGNVTLIVCVHVIKGRAEKQLRREFIALCKEPLLAMAAAGEDGEFQRRNSDVLSISGKINDESVLCEVTAKALRKLSQDRRKLLSCRNADVLLLGSIGQGNFGQIYRARYRGSMVAVKTFTFATVRDIELEHFWHEAAISQRLQHPNILSFFGASISVPEKTAYCIIELGEGGTFDDVLSNQDYTWVNGRRNIMQGLSRAMCYLHSFLGDIIIHHDLKPSNILISKTFEAKLSDFGVSISRPRHPGAAPESAQEQSHKEVESLDGPRAKSPEINKTFKKQSTVRGSPVYLAPEVHRGEAFSEKIDVYAFGLILCEALIGDGLYVVKSYKSQKGGLAEALASGFRPSIPESVRVAVPGLVELMQECWAEDANARPSFLMINQRFETLVEEEIEARTSAVSSTSQPGTSETDGSNLFSVHGISELKAGTNAENESFKSTDDESISEASQSGKNMAVITQSLSAESLPSVVLASHQHTREVRVPSVVGLLQRGDTISSAMVPSMQRSPTGRSFSTFAFPAVGAAGQETGVFRELCSELQEELRQQSEMYECKLAEQKEKYEKQLASLAEALL